MCSEGLCVNNLVNNQERIIAYLSVLLNLSLSVTTFKAQNVIDKALGLILFTGLFVPS